MTLESIIKLLEIQLLEDAIHNLDARENLPGTDGYKTVKDELTGLTVEEQVEKQAEQFYFKQSEGWTIFHIEVKDNNCFVSSINPADKDGEFFQPDPA